MLSYLHAFHAGNHADVLKHAVLAQVLEYIGRKDKPFVYIDTHAGSGRYDLGSARATKVGEYTGGIGRLWTQSDATPAALQPYLQVVRALNPDGALRHYPGSPWLARALLRPQDRACLFELHPNEFVHLQDAFAGDRRVRCEQADGFQSLRALLPPPERRGVILVDPPYEVKSDYRTAVQALAEAYRRFATGVYLLWYPVLGRRQVKQLERDLVESGMRNILLAELCIAPDAPQSGMTGSGMIVINPTWQLEDTLRTLLPYLQRTLAAPGGPQRLLKLVEE